MVVGVTGRMLSGRIDEVKEVDRLHHGVVAHHDAVHAALEVLAAVAVRPEHTEYMLFSFRFSEGCYSIPAA